MKELSHHVLDILGNSVRAGADRITLRISERVSINRYELVFEDNGKGMDEKILADIFNPWVTTRKERRVGMGLSLLKQAAELCGGSLSISSTLGQGTTVTVLFEQAHLDRPVAGDMAGSVVMTAASSPEVDLVYIHETDTGSYQFSSAEVRKILDGTSLAVPAMMKAVQEMVQENLNDIGAEGDRPFAMKRLMHS